MSFSLSRRLLRTAPEEGDPPVIAVGDWRLPIKFRPHVKARRFILRLDPKSRAVVVTMPPRASQRDALAFVYAQIGWISERLDETAGTVAFEDGAIIPLRGDNHRVRHCPGERGTVWIVQQDGRLPELAVAGESTHLPRRLTDWLKREARRELTERVQHHADAMGFTPGRISVRDQASRWGSCSSSGGLSFSWRLILMPPAVLDYVAAHEVAHLGEMNHSPRFWALVARTVADVKAQKRWLRRHGQDMHRFGGPT